MLLLRRTTAGGAPVTIETLFGLVKVGIAASASVEKPSRIIREMFVNTFAAFSKLR